MKNLALFLLIVAAGGYFGSKWYLHNEVAKGMDMAILMMSPYANVNYAGVSSTLTGELTIEDVRVRVDGFNDEIRIERLGIDTPSFLSLVELGEVFRMRGEDMPEYFGFIVEGLHMPANADYYRKFYEFALAARGVDDAYSDAAECTGRYGFSPRALSDLGYAEQVISASMTIRDQRDRYSLDVDMAIEEMWAVEASMTLAGDMMSELSRGVAYRPRLQAVTVRMTDRSLNQRVSDYCVQRGLTRDETLQARLDSFSFLGEENGIEFDEYVLEPYREFIGGKSTIVFTARPNEPLALTQISLYKPSDVPALLNLEASTL